MENLIRQKGFGTGLVCDEIADNVKNIYVVEYHLK